MPDTPLLSKEECLNSAFDKHPMADTLTVDISFEAMDMWAKQQSIAFFKWYAIKMMGFIEYLQKVKPQVVSDEIEEKLKEFEGKPFDELYTLFKEQSK